MRIYPFLIMLACSVAPCPNAASARVLLLSHFDNTLDADHGLYGEPKAESRGLQLSTAPSSGKDFKEVASGKALDAGYTDSSKGDACVNYSAVNLSARAGTIEMWVKPGYTADPERALKQDIWRSLMTAPLGASANPDCRNFMSLYYAYYVSSTYVPVLMFQIQVNGMDYIATARLAHDEAGNGIPWEKDKWYYVAATWTPTKLRLFINGKLAAEATPEKPIDLPPVSGPIVIGNDFRYERLARAMIDELRISDAPLPAGAKEIPVPTAPLGAN